MADFWYLIRWPFYLLGCLFHGIYRVTVFFSKPGAPLLMAYLCHALVLWLHVYHQGWPSYPQPFEAVAWYNLSVDWISLDREALGMVFWPMVTLLIASMIFMVFPHNELRAGLGLFPAMAKPLPPRRRIAAPKFKIKAQRARVIVRKKRTPSLALFAQNRTSITSDALVPQKEFSYTKSKFHTERW